jgi:hypothetical protein
VRWLVIVPVLAGCDALLRLEDIHPIDAPPDAAPCVGGFFEDFTMPTDAPPCGDWAAATGQPTWMQREARGLVVTPIAGVVDYVGCQANSLTSFGSNGVIVHVPMVTTNQAYTSFIVDTYTSFTDTMPNASTSLFEANGNFAFADQATCAAGNCVFFLVTAYAASETQWWRMLPADQGATIASQVSADGVQWVDYATRSLGAPGAASFISVSLVGGNTSADPTLAPGMGVYASLADCPN